MLLSITTWWQHLETFEKILWGIAITFTSFYLIQGLLSISGGDADDVDGDVDGDIEHDDGAHHQFFTLKNMIAFFTMFGWVGLAAYYGGMSKTITIVLAFAAGTTVVLIMVFLLANISRLRHNGALQIENAVNKTGSTYLFIPARRTGIGKVHITVQGSLRELPAITDDETEIATGKLIRVKKIVDDQLLLVTVVENNLTYNL